MVSTPKYDAGAAAQAQGNENMKWGMAQSIMGNVNENNPYASVHYSNIGQEPIMDAQGRVTGYAPRWQKDITLSPAQQQLLDLQNASMKNLGQLAQQQTGMLKGLLAKPVTAAGLPAWQTYNQADPLRRDETPTDRPAIEAAAMASRQRANAPREQAEEAQLAARGLSPGSAQWGQVQQGREDAFSEAARQAYLMSGQESRQQQAAYNQAVAQKFNQDNAWTSAQNALRGQELQERENLQSFPVSLATALMSGSQPTVSQFQPYNAPNIQSVPIGEYMGNEYNARAQNAANMNQGIFGLAGAAAKMLPWGRWFG
jgi:hypothetical protein